MARIHREIGRYLLGSYLGGGTGPFVSVYPFYLIPEPIYIFHIYN